MAKQTAKQKAKHFKAGEKRPANAGRKKGSLNQRTKIKIALGLKDDEELGNKILKMGEDLYEDAKKDWDKRYKIFETIIRVAFNKKQSASDILTNAPATPKVYESPAFKKDYDTENINSGNTDASN